MWIFQRGARPACWWLMLVFVSPYCPAGEPALAKLKNLHVGMTLLEMQSLESADGGFGPQEFHCRTSEQTAICSSRTTVAQVSADVSLRFVEVESPAQPLPPSYLRSLSDDVRSELQRKKDAGYQLAAINILIQKSSHHDLLDAYKLKVGAPRVSTTEAYTNYFGAVFPGSLHRWASGDVSASLYERCGRVDQSCLLIQSARLMERLRSVTEPSERERQKDL